MIICDKESGGILMGLNKYKIVAIIIVILLFSGSLIDCKNGRLETKRTVPGENTVVLLTPGTGAERFTRNPTFTWEPIPDAISYDFEITDFKPPLDEAHQFNKTIYSTNTPNTPDLVLNQGTQALVIILNIPTLPYYDTMYFWRVRAITADGSAHHWSVSQFVTELPPPIQTSMNDPFKESR
jgi:hypothetical protein